MADILGAGALGKLTDEVASRRAVTAKIRALLPEDEANHLISASINSTGELVLAMDSPVWAAKVRYRQGILGSQKLRIRVVPPG